MIYITIILLIVALDQITKHIIEEKMKINETKEILKDKLYLKRITNKGAFYGIFENKPFIVLKSSFLIIIALILLFIKTLKSDDSLLKLIITFIIGGAIGNIIDRLKKGSVTDFIFIKFKNAPIFNIADIFLFLAPIVALIRSLKQ